jgi:hypothetical protein
MVIGYSLPERFVFKGTEWFDRIGFKNGFFQGQGLVFIELLKLLILDSWFQRIWINFFLDGWFWSAKGGSGYWIGFGFGFGLVFRVSDINQLLIQM